MDHPRTDRKSRLPRRLLAVTGLLAAGAALVLLARMDFATWRVERDRVQIAEVRHGDLDVTVAANGVLLPSEIELLTSRVEGTVSKLMVKAGDVVGRGQVLAELSNPGLRSVLDIAHAALEEARAEELSARADIENQMLDRRSAVTQLRFALDKARLELEAKRRLITTGVISRIEFQQSELDVRQMEEMVHIEEERLARMEANRESRMEVRLARVRQAEQTLARALSDIEALHILAGMDGVVQEIGVDFGQRLLAGDEVGRLARQDRLHAELLVPSRQAADLALGQRVELDTRNGVLEGVVSRIDPRVSDGGVAVDVSLRAAPPASARPQLPVEGTIYVAEITNGLYVRKPAYSRGHARQIVYVLEPGGRYAVRRAIEVGRTSVNYMEVLSGLAAGERLILTENDEWREHDRILLN